jgi:hypothetical protein
MTTSPVPVCDEPSWVGSDPDINRLFDNVQAMVPGVTSDMVLMQSWNTIQDFYQRSTIRREHIYWQMNPGVLTLNFDPFDQNWRVCKFLQFKGLSNVKFEPPGRIRDLASPVPTNVRNGEILLALKPANVNVALPYDIWTDHFEALLAGVMYRLLMQPQKPYSDVQGARLHFSMYARGIAQARARVQSGNVTDGVLWRFPYFATGHPKGIY